MAKKAISEISVKVVAASNDNAVAEEAIPPGSNVLPRTATPDEQDVHWLFNWAEGDMGAPPAVSVHQQSLTGRVSGAGGPSRDHEPGEGERAAARRSSRIRAILLALPPEQVSALARWSVAPSRIPAPIGQAFGRLSAVTGLTPGYREIGGGEALHEACELAVARVKGDKVLSIRRHLAKVKLEVIHRQAEALLAEAWAGYAKAREAHDAARRPRPRRDPLAEAIAFVTGQIAANEGAASAQGAQ